MKKIQANTDKCKKSSGKKDPVKESFPLFPAERKFAINQDVLLLRVWLDKREFRIIPGKFVRELFDEGSGKSCAIIEVYENYDAIIPGQPEVVAGEQRQYRLSSIFHDKDKAENVGRSTLAVSEKSCQGTYDYDYEYVRTSNADETGEKGIMIIKKRESKKTMEKKNQTM